VTSDHQKKKKKSAAAADELILSINQSIKSTKNIQMHAKNT